MGIWVPYFYFGYVIGMGIQPTPTEQRWTEWFTGKFGVQLQKAFANVVQQEPLDSNQQNMVFTKQNLDLVRFKV